MASRMDSPGRILLVDDDQHIRSTFAVSLRAKGFDVAECNDGLEALAWLQQNRADYLITGIKMPNLGGFELIEKIKQQPQLHRMPFFVFSHRGDESDRQRARELGAADFFVYGFVSPNDVAAAIRNLHTP